MMVRDEATLPDVLREFHEASRSWLSACWTVPWPEITDLRGRYDLALAMLERRIEEAGGQVECGPWKYRLKDGHVWIDTVRDNGENPDPLIPGAGTISGPKAG